MRCISTQFTASFIFILRHAEYVKKNPDAETIGFKYYSPDKKEKFPLMYTGRFEMENPKKM
jgi:hypothetical protein